MASSYEYERSAFVYIDKLPRPVKVEWNGRIDVAGVKKLAVREAPTLFPPIPLFALLGGAHAGGPALNDVDAIDVAAATND